MRKVSPLSSNGENRKTGQTDLTLVYFKTISVLRDKNQLLSKSRAGQQTDRQSDYYNPLYNPLEHAH